MCQFCLGKHNIALIEDLKGFDVLDHTGKKNKLKNTALKCIKDNNKSLLDDRTWTDWMDLLDDASLHEHSYMQVHS